MCFTIYIVWIILFRTNLFLVSTPLEFDFEWEIMLEYLGNNLKGYVDINMQSVISLKVGHIFFSFYLFLSGFILNFCTFFPTLTKEILTSIELCLFGVHFTPIVTLSTYT
eukprot:TRINITY_DN32786_c0_g1_i2.p3 TRINITY_DN32786_c0_g1~~TRINITY_DN32786_c0_g1_i2.p3  ORF type:complete len:110 (+),score=2.75 TRINITY_DN32786_c0_g1_i2:172-501(+)